MKTSLKLYNLWYDGVAEVAAKDVERFVTLVPSGKLAVDELTASIRQYNSLVAKSEAISVKRECNPLDYNWNIPEKYRCMDIKLYLLDKLQQIDDCDDVELKNRVTRTLHELGVFTKAGLIPLLQCLIYIIDTFVERQVVWGVGRGSSVSSYVLYLIGVHDIDCMLFNLPFSDFMKT